MKSFKCKNIILYHILPSTFFLLYQTHEIVFFCFQRDTHVISLCKNKNYTQCISATNCQWQYDNENMETTSTEIPIQQTTETESNTTDAVISTTISSSETSQPNSTVVESTGDNMMPVNTTQNTTIDTTVAPTEEKIICIPILIYRTRPTFQQYCSIFDVAIACEQDPFCIVQI